MKVEFDIFPTAEVEPGEYPRIRLYIQDEFMFERDYVTGPDVKDYRFDGYLNINLPFTIDLHSDERYAFRIKELELDGERRALGDYQQIQNKDKTRVMIGF